MTDNSLFGASKGKDKESVPLSFAQQRLWFLDQLEPGTPLYNIPLVLRLSGQINAVALELSLNEIIRRHQVLRTTFPVVDDQPQQNIADSLTIKLSTVDLTDIPDGERAHVVNEHIRKYAQQRFNLANGPLIRATLIQLEKDMHILVLVMHHIISDGWSMGVLFRELSALYEAFTSGKPSPLPELPIQYADFSEWQRQWLQGEVLERQLSYWKNQLTGLPVLELPTDRQRPSVQSFRGARQSALLSRNLADRLKALSREERVTPFMTLLAAFQTLLNRYTGQEDIVIGSPIAGRNRAKIEGLIGFFVNTIVLRTDLSGNPTFRELLSRVREVAIGAYEHQDVPFERLVEVLQPKRVPGHNPLFQAMFALQNAPISRLELSNLTVSPVEIGIETAKFDLSLVISETEEGKMRFRISYNTGLFESPTIEKMLSNYKDLLTILVNSPDRQISTLPKFTHKPSTPPHAREKKEDHTLERSNLTKNQLLIWTEQKLYPEAPIYNVVHIFTIQGEVNPERFQKAFQTLINSSDALRTVFEETDGVPRQRVIGDFPYKVEYLDYSRLPEPDKELQTWVKNHYQVPFDFDVRLFEAVLIKLSNKTFVWYFAYHHIILDGISLALVFQYTSDFYNLSLKGELEERVELPAFQDYVKYERSFRGSNKYLGTENYWKQKLAEDLEPITFYGREPIKQTTDVQRLSYELGIDRTQKLKSIALQKDTPFITLNFSLFNIFMAMLFAYLHRVSGIRRLSIATPFHNRFIASFKNTIGLLMEVYPLRITIDKNETFLSLIKKVTTETIETLKHLRYTTGNPIKKKAYDVILNYRTASFPNFHGAPVKTDWIHSGHENDSLAVEIHDFSTTGSLFIDFDFHCDVFSEERRKLAVQHFIQMLDAFLEDSTQSIQEVNLLTYEEKHQVLEEFNQTEAEFPEDRCIHQLFEAQAERTPEAEAVVFEDQYLTYKELNARANQLAHYLISIGVEPETLVGLCLDRSIEMFIGLLGILKAGGAYLPLDPSYPHQRLAFMLGDANVRVLLTQDRFVERLRELSADIVCIDSKWADIVKMNTENPVARVYPDNLAYVIYTSGSTGIPKGVAIEHRSVLNHSLDVSRRFNLEETDRVLQFYSINFDGAVEEIFPSLISGSTLVLRGEDIIAPGAEFTQFIETHEISVVDLPTAYWHQWTEDLSQSTLQLPSSLRLVIVGGDKVSGDRFKAWQDLVGNRVRWIDTYGPTETTVISSAYEPECTTGHEELHLKLSIGKPINNTQIYVLDTSMEPVPMGVTGEIYIGGLGLARCYLNHSQLTAEKFIPDPFAKYPGSRIYKTGDLARFLTHGNIEFLGRIDNQRKLRGYRIELGEIEAVLKGHPVVRDAFVVLREDRPGETKLVAYLGTQQEQESIISELRGFLKQKLPEFMLPAAFVLMDTFPLTPNGKIDRQALPPPDESRPYMEGQFVAPGTVTEKTLADIWSEVLGVGNVGIYDNFFDIGGHSLLSIQLIVRIEHELGVRLNPRDLMFQTLGQIATLCDERIQTQEDSDKASLKEKGAEFY